MGREIISPALKESLPGLGALVRVACSRGRGPTHHLTQRGYRYNSQRGPSPGGPGSPGLGRDPSSTQSWLAGHGAESTGSTPSGPGSHTGGGGVDSRRLGEKSLQALPRVAGMSAASQRAPWGVSEVQSPAQLHAAVEARTEEGHRAAFSLHSPGLSTGEMGPPFLFHYTDAQGHRTPG